MKYAILASTTSTISQQTFTPLAEWVWQVANATLIVFGVIAGIFWETFKFVGNVLMTTNKILTKN